MTPRAQIAGRVAAIVFFVAYALLFLFIDRFRDGAPQSFVLFWALVLTIFVSLLYQIYSLGNDAHWQNVVLLEIALLGLFFRVVHLALTDGRTLMSDDGYFILKSAEYIREGNTDFFTQGPDYGRWPFAQLLLVSLANVSGLELFRVFFLFPTLLSTLGTFLAYLVAKQAYQDGRVALLASLLFSSYYYNAIGMGTSAHPMFLAFLFFMACVAVFFRRPQFGMGVTLLALAFMLAMPPTNQESSAHLAGFVGVVFLASLVPTWSFRSKGSFGIDRHRVFLFLAATVVAVFGYWVYVGEPLFEFVVALGREWSAPVYLPSLGGPSAKAVEFAIRDQIQGYGHYAYTVIFLGIAAAELLRFRCQRWRVDLAFALFSGLYFLLFFMMGGLFQVWTPWGGHVGKFRYFAFPILAMVVAHVGFKGGRWLRVALGMLVLGYLVVNVASYQNLVPPNLVGRAALDPASGDVGQKLTALQWIDNTAKQGQWVALDYRLFAHAYGLKLVQPGKPTVRSADLFDGDMLGLRRMSWLLINPSDAQFDKEVEGLRAPVAYRLDEATLRRLEESYWLPRVYDNGELIVYGISR